MKEGEKLLADVRESNSSRQINRVKTSLEVFNKYTAAMMHKLLTNTNDILQIYYKYI